MRTFTFLANVYQFFILCVHNDIAWVPSQNNILDTKSNITVMATVQQNILRSFSSSIGQLPITDLTSDFRIRIPAPASTEVSICTCSCHFKYNKNDTNSVIE